MKKKILSVLTVAAMATSMTMSAFAFDVTGGSAAVSTEEKAENGAIRYTIAFESMQAEPTIASAITTEFDKVYINPYALDVSIDGGEAVQNTLLIGDVTIDNKGSDCNASVAITTTAKPDGTVKVATTADMSKVTAPSIYAAYVLENKAGDKFMGAKGVTNDSATALKSVISNKATACATVPVLGHVEDAGDEVLVITFEGAAGGSGWTKLDKYDLEMVFNIAPSASVSSFQ